MPMEGDYSRDELMNEEEAKGKFNQGGFLVPEFISKPTNKWNGFKQHYFPQWLQYFFPVKEKKLHLVKYIKDILTKGYSEEEWK